MSKRGERFVIIVPVDMSSAVNRYMKPDVHIHSLAWLNFVASLLQISILWHSFAASQFKLTKFTDSNV